MRPQNSVIPFILRLSIYLLLPCLIVVILALTLGGASPRRVISYVMTKGYSKNIYLMDVGLGIIRKATDLPVFRCCPIWSPDGRQIAFSSNNRSYVVNIYDGKEQLLNTPAWSSWPEAWSPDSASLVLMGEPNDDAYGLYYIDVENKNFHKLTANLLGSRIPAWSPDGRYIFFMSISMEYGNWNIYRMDSEGNHIQQLTNGVDNDMFPAVSPDSQRVAFVSLHEGDQDLYLMNIDGSEVQRLTWTPGLEIRPKWSPDGDQILFESQIEGIAPTRDIYVIKADGSNLHQVATGIYGSNVIQLLSSTLHIDS